jgi:DNA-binding transcriptional MerR regulator
MDAQTLASTAGVALGTLNMWVQRGIIPGEKVGRGRRRDFSLDTAINVRLIAELTRLGLGAAAAAAIARGRRQSRRLALFTRLAPLLGGDLRGELAVVHDPQRWASMHIVHGFENDAELPGILEKEFPGARRPIVYAIIDVEQIAVAMREAYEQWERRGEAKAES